MDRVKTFILSRGTGIALLLTAVGLALRLWGINFGLPYVYHVDEQSYVARALYIGQGQLVHIPYTPTGMSNLIFVEYAIYFVVGKLTGLFPSVSVFEAAYRTDPSTFYLLGRLISAVLGALTVPVTFVLGRKMALLRGMDENISIIFGTVAGLLMAVCFLHVRDSHYATPDAAVTFFTVLTTTILLFNLYASKHWLSFLGGFSAGTAFAFKWTAAPVFFVVVVYLLILWINQKSFRRFPTREALITIAGCLLGVFIISPQFIIGPSVYFNEFIGQFRSGSSGGFDYWQIDTVSGWLFYAKTAVVGFGLLVVLLAIFGIGISITKIVRDRDASYLLILSFPIIYFLMMGSTRHYFVRYALLLLPFISVFAADAIVTIAIWMGKRVPIQRVVLALVLAAITAMMPLVNDVLHNQILTREDTRTEAKDWIETNIPDQAKIAMDWAVHGPPLSSVEEPMPYSKKTYQVTVVQETGLAEHAVEWYREKGYNYLITSSFISDLHLVFPDQDSKHAEFYRSLDDQLVLVKTFEPFPGYDKAPFVFDEIYGPYVSIFQRVRPGPVIKVYKIQ